MHILYRKRSVIIKLSVNSDYFLGIQLHSNFDFYFVYFFLICFIYITYIFLLYTLYILFFTCKQKLSIYFKKIPSSKIKQCSEKIGSFQHFAFLQIAFLSVSWKTAGLSYCLVFNLLFWLKYLKQIQLNINMYECIKVSFR